MPPLRPAGPHGALHLGLLPLVDDEPVGAAEDGAIAHGVRRLGAAGLAQQLAILEV